MRPNRWLDEVVPERREITDDKLRRKCITYLCPKLSLDGRSHDVIAAMFEVGVDYRLNMMPY